MYLQVDITRVSCA